MKSNIKINKKIIFFILSPLNYMNLLFNKEKIKTNNRINLLTAEKTEIDKSISNLLAAVEKGLFSNATNLRLKQLEEQQAIINEQLILEKSKNKSALTKEDILDYELTVFCDEKPRLDRFFGLLLGGDEFFFRHINPASVSVCTVRSWLRWESEFPQ